MYPSNSTETVNAFVSCSIRPRDWSLINTLVKAAFEPMGFRCFTVGRNVAFADQTDDAVRNLINNCDCLIGVATERLNATDRDFPSQTLRLATPYLLEEASMAYQLRLPFLMFKAKGVTLLGVTNRNLWIDIDEQLHNGKVRFYGTPQLVHSALRDLKQKALERRRNIGWENTNRSIERLSKWALGGYGTYRLLDWLGRPECFGEFYYKDLECQECSYKEQCKVKKAELKRNN
jgi:hypothetical protein